MLAAVGENDERCLEIFGVATGLLLRVVGVEVFALRFEHAEHPAETVFEQVVGSPVRRMQLKLDLLGIQQIPPAELQAPCR